MGHSKAEFAECLLVTPSTERHWQEYHRIRREQIFEPINIIYDPNHWTMTSPLHKHFVFIKGATVIGVVQVELADEQMTILRPIAIDAPYQNQGYGTQLLQMIERWVGHQGRKALYLHAAPQALNFYKRLGYTEMSFPDPERELETDDVDLGKMLIP